MPVVWAKTFPNGIVLSPNFQAVTDLDHQRAWVTSDGNLHRGQAFTVRLLLWLLGNVLYKCAVQQKVRIDGGGDQAIIERISGRK